MYNCSCYVEIFIIAINFVVNPTVRSIFEEITHAVMDNLIIVLTATRQKDKAED